MESIIKGLVLLDEKINKDNNIQTILWKVIESYFENINYYNN